MDAQQERRRSSRYSVDLPIKVTRTTEGNRAWHRGRGTDFGEGGLKALVATDLVVGEIVYLEIQIPYSSQPIALSSTVRNRSGYTYGLEFLSLTRSDQAAIARACSVLSLLKEGD
jgi:hypothetical protein